MTKPLSPTAAAVLDASNLHPCKDSCLILATALEAVADQRVELEVPFSVVDEWERVKGSCASFYAAAEWGHNQVVKELRAIAAELKANAQ